MSGAGRGALRALPCYGSLSPWARELLEQKGRLLVLEPHQRAFREGEPCERSLLVLEGTLRVQKVSSGGHEIVLHHVGPGEACHLSAACLLGGSRHPAEAVAETAVRAWSLPRTAFERLFREDPAFRGYVEALLQRGLQGLVDLVQAVAFGALDARLARALLGHADASGTVALTHQELAAELGTAREVVSRLLKELERHGWVRLGRGRVRLLDREALARLATPSQAGA